MKIFERLTEIRVGYVTFPLSNYFFNRKNILPNYKNLKRSEYYSEDELRDIQLNKLKNIIRHAYNYVPFYRQKFKDINLHPEDLRMIEDLRQIPPLSRQEVIDHHKDMVDYRFKSSIPYADSRKEDPGTPIPFARFKKHKLLRNTSSGSTGAPTIFYEEGSRTALNWVHEMRLKSWFNINPGAKEARLVKLSFDYSPGNKTIRMRKALWNQLILPGTNLSDDDYEVCLKSILDFKPKVLYGFPAALAGLADFVDRNSEAIGSYRPILMIGWAGPVYEHEEKIMKKVFGCHVSNNYGAREVGHVAGRCPAGSMHINQENHIVESIPVNGDKSTQESGELLVTPIDVSPMPFIRYRMGDIGEVESSNCECGRTLPVIKNFLGRTGEIFITRDGRMIPPNFWCRFFFVNQFSNAVRRFQVIYKKSKDLKIKIEKDFKYTDEVEQFIKDGINRNFSQDTKLELEYVPKIEPQLSGKYQMVVKEK